MKSDAQGSSFTHREEAHGIQANEAVGIVEETGDADGERRAVENKNTLAGDQRKRRRRIGSPFEGLSIRKVSCSRLGGRHFDEGCERDDVLKWKWKWRLK